MPGTIRVENLLRKGANGAVYIGRAWRSVPASPLGNPRVVGGRRAEGGRWTAAETLPHYERELRAALDRGTAEAWWDGRLLSAEERAAMRAVMNDLYRRVRAGETVVLDCHCRARRPGNASAAERPCHGDVIARIVGEAIARRQR